MSTAEKNMFSALSLRNEVVCPAFFNCSVQSAIPDFVLLDPVPDHEQSAPVDEKVA